MIKTGWRELTPSGQLGLLKSRQRNRESRADWETQTGNYSKLTEWIPDRDKENTVEQSKASVWDSFTAAGSFQPTVGELRKHCHTMWGEKTRTSWAARGRRRATLAEITIGWWLHCWEESAEGRRQHLHDSASGGNTILSSQHSVSIRYWQKPWPLIHTEVQKCSVYFSFYWVCAQGYDGHTCKSTCVCMWGWCIGVQAHPTFALGIFLQFSALHVVQLGLSIKPRDGRLMMLASQLSQESPSLFTRGCHTHPSLHRIWG